MNLREKNKASHVTKGNVFEDLGFSSEEAALLRLKTTLHIEILKVVEKRKLTGRELEKLLDVPQPRVSEIINGKISKMTVDRLTKYLHRLGKEVRVMTKNAPKLQRSEVV